MTSDFIFVDSSWFKALLDEKDEFHSLALDQYQKIKSEKMSLATTNYIIDETLTLLRVKVSLDLALKFRETLLRMRNTIRIIRVLASDEAQAWKWFPKNWSKLSFTDCISFAVMKRLDLKKVATFDKHFTQAGFKVRT